jgi:hypothetical protein
MVEHTKERAEIPLVMRSCPAAVDLQPENHQPFTHLYTPLHIFTHLYTWTYRDIELWLSSFTTASQMVPRFSIRFQHPSTNIFLAWRQRGLRIESAAGWEGWALGCFARFWGEVLTNNTIWVENQTVCLLDNSPFIDELYIYNYDDFPIQMPRTSVVSLALEQRPFTLRVISKATAWTWGREDS